MKAEEVLGSRICTDHQQIFKGQGRVSFNERKPILCSENLFELGEEKIEKSGMHFLFMCLDEISWTYEPREQKLSDRRFDHSIINAIKHPIAEFFDEYKPARFHDVVEIVKKGFEFFQSLKMVKRIEDCCCLELPLLEMRPDVQIVVAYHWNVFIGYSIQEYACGIYSIQVFESSPLEKSQKHPPATTKIQERAFRLEVFQENGNDDLVVVSHDG